MLFVCTGNGVDDAHINIPAQRTELIAVDKTSGKGGVLTIDWDNILHGNGHRHLCSPRSS